MTGAVGRAHALEDMAAVTTPKELGYRMPAEWEPQEAVWFAWPVRRDLWPGAAEKARARLAALYAAAARFQTVRVLCPSENRAELSGYLGEAGGGDGIEIYDYCTEDVWCRDFAPLFLVSEESAEVCATDWRFNAWGRKFPQWERDDRTPEWMAGELGLRRFTFDTVLEGGAVESNGAGDLLTTEAVLLNPNRNPGMDRRRVQTLVGAGLGVDRFRWLGRGLAGDDTDGHIDNLARFFKVDGIVVAETADPEDPNYEPLQENLERIQSFRMEDGRPFASVSLPLPDSPEGGGRPVAASYLNYLVLNGGVLVPTFGQPENDGRALEIIRDCYPGRVVEGVDSRVFLEEGGGPHCLSQNQPARPTGGRI